MLKYLKIDYSWLDLTISMKPLLYFEYNYLYVAKQSDDMNTAKSSTIMRTHSS